MNMKKIAVILILAIVLVSTVNTIYAEDKEYSITNAFLDLTVGQNGLLHVNESYTYSFEGTFNGVYRDIPLKDGESIDNIEVYVYGAYATYELINENNNQRIKVYLWADPAHTQKIHDQDVTITYSYDMYNVVTLFNDIGSLQYKLWGEDWDVDVGKLTADIQLPGNTSNTYYLNPEYYNLSDSLNGNTIHIETTSIPSGEFYELQVLMPLDDFKNSTYANHVNENGKEQIMQKQAEYKSSVGFWGTIFNAISTLCLISPLSLIFVYLRYGREPKVDYYGIYERELPTDDPPAVVNALIENNHAIGNPDMKGFEATIMDLIDRKVFKIHTEEGNYTDELILEFDESKYDTLERHEQTVFNTLKNFSRDGLLNVSRLSSQLNNETSGKYFKKQFENWKEDVINEYLDDATVSRYFHGTGSTLQFAFAVLGLSAAIVLFIVCSLSNHPASSLTLIASIILAVISLALFFLPEDILGQWTPEGRVYYLKWKNFKKFLTDNSLIKEHPPESIVVWNKYLVYGTALGIADEVYEAMKLHAPRVSDDDYYYSDLYRFHSFSGLIMLDSAFDTGINAANPSSSSGGFGGIGGGSGGGGGGAF